MDSKNRKKRKLSKTSLLFSALSTPVVKHIPYVRWWTGAAISKTGLYL